MTQKTGALIFDETADRYDIRFDVNDYYGGLHCGDCMEVFVRGKWKPTRMAVSYTHLIRSVVLPLIPSPRFPDAAVVGAASRCAASAYPSY